MNTISNLTSELMKFSLSIAYRGLAKDAQLDAVIYREAERLGHLSDRLKSCNVLVEAPVGPFNNGEYHRVTLSVIFQSETELVINHEACLRGFFRRKGVSHPVRDETSDLKNLERAIVTAFMDAQCRIEGYERTLQSGRSLSALLNGLEAEVRISA